MDTQQPTPPTPAKPTVIMRSPEGETKEVDASAAVLVPLMAQGWVQVKAADVPVKGE